MSILKEVKIKEPKYYAAHFRSGEEQDFIKLMIGVTPFRGETLDVSYSKDKIPTITLGDWTIRIGDWIVVKDSTIEEVMTHNEYVAKYENKESMFQ